MAYPFLKFCNKNQDLQDFCVSFRCCFFFVDRRKDMGVLNKEVRILIDLQNSRNKKKLCWFHFSVACCQAKGVTVARVRNKK
jgi:hypothetical protein